MNLLQLIKFHKLLFHYTVLPYFPVECDGFISIKKKRKLSKVVRINFHGGKINFYGGKNQFQEEHVLLQATPNSLKLAICDGRVALE